eukprot:8077293-Ditylum_brightwellii.AAC.1
MKIVNRELDSYPANPRRGTWGEATGPPPSMYPGTEITVHVEGDKSNIIHEMLLDPVTTDYEHKVHIVLTTKIAVIPPGR